MAKALYPGTFDPITYGHLDVIKRAIGIFDQVIVSVALSARKRPLFSVNERVDMIEQTTQKWDQVSVDIFDTLLVDYAKEKGVEIIIRGLRVVTEFEYEFQMALINRKLYPKFESIFLMPSAEYTYLSSMVVREVAEFGGDVSNFVPPYIESKLKEKFGTDPMSDPT